MTVDQILKSVQALPVREKLALIEALSHMVQQEIGDNSGSTDDENVKRTVRHFAGTPSIGKIVDDLLSRPNPPPEKMLQPGMFKGRIPLDDELFRMAEWHPPDEELAGD